ncbi:DUF3099 domain-containing protein [Agrococcus jejuensis]|uniref:DUF3099 domain-containing protein n=1 Tax=Agrococcus jejuensis TaxID=399736 RepID=A0A1G8H904_9MICO|nr:DUF3099 domain-containing protein [Agrococcus jejuensis]SDI03093.1 Protein of unknown function [Agrococcus jejuensis]
MQHDEPSITDLPVSPTEDRRRRTRTYLIMMGIRMVCIVLFIVLPDWWKVAPAIVAVVIPWIAVVAANASASLATKTDRVTRRQIES